MSKKDEALILAKQLRNSLLNKDQDVSILLLGCTSDCKYLGILEENEWINSELTGYDHLSNIPLKKVIK